MTSNAKRRANRANAQKSTGPRTAAGKTRSSANATRHGLAKPAAADLDAQPLIAALASAIAGEGASGALRKQASLVAEAEVDLRRARAAATHLQGSLMEAVEKLCQTPPVSPEEVAAAFDRQSGTRTSHLLAFYRDALTPAQQARYLPGMLRSMTQLVQAPRDALLKRIATTTRDLARLDRYTRRALSRRRTETRVLDEIRMREGTGIR